MRLASGIESMRSAAVGVSLGAGGVASRMTRWCSRRCSEYGGVRGGGVLGRRDDLRNDCVMLGKGISENVFSSVSGGPDEMRHAS